MSTKPEEQQRRASASVLCRIVQQIADLLNASAEFTRAGRVTVLTEDKDDIDTEIEQAVSALGLSATVGGPVFANAQAIVEIAELPVTNRSESGTGATALEQADLAARLLHQARLADGRTLLVTDIARATVLPAPATTGWNVILRLSNVSLNRKVTTT